MKTTNIKLYILSVLLAASSYLNAQNEWFINGNSLSGTEYLGSNNNWFLNIRTNNTLRMRTMAGGTGSADGRVGMGNSLGLTFIPADRLHLHQTNSDSADFNAIRFTNNFTGVGFNGTQMGIVNLGQFIFNQFETQPFSFFSPDSRNAGAMTNWLHIANGLTGYAGYSTDGYVGLNEDSAKFHLDIKTPFKNLGGISYGGELFLSCRTSDVPYSRMGMLNIAGGNGVFAPSLFGNLDSNQINSALTTLAIIHTKQDSSFNIQPVQQFIVGRDWDYNTNAIDAISQLENRNAFAWKNFNQVKMLINAKGRVRIGTAINLSDTIKNRLVITSSTIDPGLGVPTTVGGSSGLQFTNLTAATPPLTTNPGDGVLAVDSMGNVVYVDANTVGFGNFCSQPQNPLTNNWEIPLDIFNYNFSGKGAVNITRTTTCTPTSKFLVDDNLFSVTSIVRNNTNTPGNIAGMFIGSSASKVHALVVPFDGGNVGFGTTSPNPTYRLEVFGGSNFNGNIFQNGVLISSDQNLKTNIDTISSALTIINQLAPKTFFFDTTNVYGMNFSNKKQYGFIAQEVELILPELIENLTKDAVVDSSQNVISQAINYKTLNYNAFIAILMKGMQEQQSTIDSMNVLVASQDSINTDLEDRLATLEACINNIGICNNNGGGNGQGNNRGNTQTVTLQNINAIILQQNLPNPFAESTQINYVLPDDVLNAKMLFYDMNGRIINEVNINERGNGTLTVYGENLEKGIYTYSLIADGKLISTKKMVKK